jgi:hypothetical protein
MAVGTTAAHYILKAYASESDAITDTNPFKVNDTDDANIYNSKQSNGVHFFTHEKYYFRIESNLICKEFYIDWDDGEDNKTKANYSSIKLSTPADVGITSHIFTREKQHYPKIRAMNTEGFWSKYYQPHGDHSFSGIAVLQGETTLPVGLQGTYPIQSDTDDDWVDPSTTSGYLVKGKTIPIFSPTPKPPKAVLKTDKKRVYAGIDNSKMVTQSPASTPAGYMVFLGCNNSNRTSVQVEVTCQIDTGLTYAGETRGENVDDGAIIKKTLTLFDGDAYSSQSPAGSYTNYIPNAIKVLKVELLNQKESSDTYLGNSDVNNLARGERMFVITNAGGSGRFSGDFSGVVASVSLGNPILYFEEENYYVALDASESVTRTSDQSISHYYFDDGHLHTDAGISDGENIQTVSTTNVSDEIFAGDNNYFKQTTPRRNASYNFEPEEHFIDSDKRFIPYGVLARVQVEAAATTLPADASATYLKSPIEHWQYDDYKVDKTVNPYNWPSDMQSSALLCYKNMLNENRWEDMTEANASGDDFSASQNEQLLNGTAALSSANYPQRMGGGSSNYATSLSDNGNENFMIVARDSKWESQYWRGGPNNTNQGGGSTPYLHKPVFGNNTVLDGFMNLRTEVFYSAPAQPGSSTHIWKPLKFTNRTKYPDEKDTTWFTPGLWFWDAPDDWVAIDPTDIPDSLWPGGQFEGALDKFACHIDDSISNTVTTTDADGLAVTNFSSGVVGTSSGSTKYLTGATCTVSTNLFSTGASISFDDLANTTITATSHASTTTSSNTNSPTFKVDTAGATQDLKDANTAANLVTCLNGLDGFSASVNTGAQEVQKITVEGAAFSGSNEIKLMTNSYGADGLTQASGSSMFGLAFYLSETTSNDSYVWFRQALQAQIYQISDLQGGSYNASTWSGEYFKIYDTSGTSFGYWWDTTGSETKPSGLSATYTKEIDISSTSSSSDWAAAMRTATNGSVSFIKTVDASISTQAPWTSTQGTGADAHEVYVTASVAGRISTAPAISWSVPQGDVSVTTYGKPQGLSVTTADGSSALSGKTGIPVDYTDGASKDTIAAALRTKLGTELSGNAVVSGSGNECIITWNTFEDRTNIADTAVGGATATGTGFTFATTTAGVAKDIVTITREYSESRNNWFDLDNKWNASNKLYGLLIKIRSDNGSDQGATAPNYDNFTLSHTWPASNSHSQYIEVFDPSCVSLNDRAIATSISYSHVGKYQVIESRLGRADIRKIGASGGVITFGGVDLVDSASTYTRDKFYQYQNNATPVYLDVEHKGGETSRFYGIITRMSEDHATGSMLPKFSVNMQVAKMITFNTSSGLITSDGFISLGGKVVDEPEYL